MMNVETTTRTHVVVPKGGIGMFHVKFKEARVFLDMAEILVGPEVTHDARGVVKYLVDAFSGLSS